MSSFLLKNELKSTNMVMGRPLTFHQGSGFTFAHPLHVAIIAIEECRNAPVGDAVGVNRPVRCLVRLPEDVKEIVVRLVEWYRDMRVVNSRFGHEQGLFRQRQRMVIKRQIDDMTHANGVQAIDVLSLQAA